MPASEETPALRAQSQPADAVGPAPRNRDELARIVRAWLEIEIPGKPMIGDHAAPMDYLAHAFFDEADASVPHAAPSTPGAPPPAPKPTATSGDCVVWASRGGGKTFLGALATALEMVFKPGIEIRILGGSMEQSQRMHAHLRAIFSIPALEGLIDGRITDRRIKLTNGSRVELLAQSQASVRGTRVQRLRCDEVELFDPQVWEAAQLTTRSKRCGLDLVHGRIECFSTMHVPHGLMHRLVEECAQGKRRLFKWGVLDVLGPCEEARACRAEDPVTRRPVHCPLLDECQGRAKERPGNADGVGVGHLSIDDAIAMKGRVSLATWESEMLCLRPSRSDAVLPEFDLARHVMARSPWDETPAYAAAPAESVAAGAGGVSDAGAAGKAVEGDTWLAGMDFGFRGLAVVLWGVVRDDVLWILRERAISGAVLKTHVEALKQSLPRPEWVGIDPAGNAANEQTGISASDVLRKADLRVRARGAPIQEGLELVRARLAPADGRPPRLLVHARCRRLIQSMECYHYPPDRPSSCEPVKDGHDHAVDALRYLVLNLDRPYKADAGGYNPSATPNGLPRFGALERLSRR